MDNSIRKDISKTAVVVDSITTGQFQKDGTETAVLRQEVTTKSYYPAQVHASDMQQNPFTAQEFNDEEQEFTAVESRVAFIDIPAGTTKEQVQAKLAPDAMLYKILSNHPILTSNHKSAIDNGITTLDDIANSQAIRFPEGDENEGRLILDANGNVQYRKVFFWNGPKDNQDLRGDADHPPYSSPELADELRVSGDGVIANQEVVSNKPADNDQSTMGA